MNKTTDYLLGILLALSICLLWLLQYFYIPGIHFIIVGALIVFIVLYNFYIKHTQWLYLSRLLMIPLCLWFVTAKDSLLMGHSTMVIAMNLLGFIGILLCCIHALLNYIDIEKTPASL